MATVGVAFGADGVAIARVRSGGRDTAPTIDTAEWLPVTDPARVGEQLEAAVDRRSLTHSHAVGVVATEDYQVVQIDAPNVPAAELRQAAAWRVRDLVDIPLDETIVDTFEPPVSAQRGTRQINAVVARRPVIDKRARAITEAGLKLVALDIPELVQRNICMRLPAARGGHALLALDRDGGLLTVFRDGELFLARSLDTGLVTLAGGGEQNVEPLVLEVQRSFDYFESALSQPPLGALYVYPPVPDADQVASAVDDSIANVESRCIGLGDIARPAADVAADAERGLVLHAVGAALRDPEMAT